VDLEKTVIRAGVSGRVEQFGLRVGDIVNPVMRPAGILIPDDAGQRSLQAGFDQIEAQIMKVGMTAEVIQALYDHPDGGHGRAGTLLVSLEPLYKGGLDGVTPGSSCIANAYSSNHELIVSEDTSATQGVVFHVVEALALVHALILRRLQALVLPFKTLVFSGH
jgi:hypothetical protein